MKLLLICCLSLAYVLAKPAGNEQLDDATANDVGLNVVSKDKKSDRVNAYGNFNAGVEVRPNKPHATVKITGITTGVDADDHQNQPFKPQRAGTMFARFIDDIFNIPITALQSVSKLLTNPFIQKTKTPEETSRY